MTPPLITITTQKIPQSHTKPKQLERRRRSITNSSMNKDINSSKDDPYNDAGMTSGYESSKSKKKRKYKSVSRKKSGGARNRLGNYTMNSKVKIPQNDFDVTTVNDGLDEIDLLIDQLENRCPEDLYEDDEIDIEAMMKSNTQLRNKIGEISKFVMTAIQKAGALKKQIITHRDGPSDPNVAKKEKEINSYQTQITR